MPTLAACATAMLAAGTAGAFTTFQNADVVIGQANFTAQNTVASQITAPGATDVAISPFGHVAVAAQSSGRVLIWNSIPAADGQPADVVVGKPNFTSTAFGATAQLTSSTDGVTFSSSGKLIVADSGNNRVLIWNTIPTTNGAAADVVIGQTDFVSSAGGTSATKLSYPSGVMTTPDGKLVVADLFNNRVLVYNAIPTVNGTAADVVIGQSTMTGNAAGAAANQLSRPWHTALAPDGRLLVAEESNNRVVVFNSIPSTNGASAAVVIGQPGFGSSASGTSATQLSIPIGVAVSASGELAIGEYLNHRVLLFPAIPVTNGAAATTVLGQPNFTSNVPFNGGVSAQSMQYVYNLAFTASGGLLVSGRNMNRVMLFRGQCGNGVVNAGEQCDDGNTLNGDCCSASCQYESSAVVCRAAVGACDVAETCTGSSATCPADGKSSAVCRGAAGVCDVAESCDGVSDTCPGDGFASSGVCRPVADVCDLAESCDGSGPNCPADQFASGGECRAAAGVCDVAESCDGASAACPADAFQPATVECRAASPGEACDLAEFCSGSDAACPADGFVAMGTPCRAAIDQCDVAESCTGSSAACPGDLKQVDGTGCDDDDTCTQTDTCQGGSCVGADPLDCDDGDGCTADSCDPLAGCVNDEAPASGCLTAQKAIVLIKNASDDGKDKLLWKWIKGAALAQMDLADPTGSAGYALCVYAGTTSALVADAAIPPGAGWSAVGAKGYKFKGSSPDGLSLVLLKGGVAGKSKALAKGKGAALPDPALPLAYPVTVQMKKNGSSLCLESTFTAADEKKNEAAQFKAKR
ncbi:hypothetical protein KF840_03405 [bacterium]|nr:hypothetical protein [bacterium]